MMEDEEPHAGEIDMSKPTPLHYTGVAKFLHWAVALIIITMLTFGQGFDDIVIEDELLFSLSAHSSLGFTVIGLIVLRILWRLGHKPPALPENVSDNQKTAAKWSHMLLYVLMVIVPLTGIYVASTHELAVMPYGAFDVREAFAFLGAEDFDGRRAIHEFSTWLLIGWLTVHILASLFHQFVQKDGVLRRMWFGKSR